MLAYARSSTNSDTVQDDWQNAPCALAVVDSMLSIVRANACLCRLAGRTSQEIEGLRLSRIFSRANQLYFESVLAPLLLIEGACNEITLNLQGAAEQIPVLVNVSTRANSPSKLYDVAIFAASARRSFEEQLAGLKAEAETRATWLTQLERLSGVGAWTYELWSKKMLWSDRVYELYGLPKDHEVSLEIALSPFPPSVRKAIAGLIERVDRDFVPIVEEVDFAHPSGDTRRMRITGQQSINLLGEPVIHGVVEDVTAAHNRQKDLWRAAHIDPMTGLGNRYHFNSEFKRRTEGTAMQDPFSLLVIDLDGFKAINDTFGHHAGDAVLKEVGRRISQFDNTIGYRLGGDEFAVILTEPYNQKSVAGSVAQLVALIGAPIDIGDASVSVCASIGVAAYPIDGQEGETLLHAADCAMYAAKRSGKERRSQARKT